MTTPFAASGKLAENIMHFGRVLRGAGLPVGPALVLDALDAALSGSIQTREDFYWTLHAVLVKKREHKELFDQAFHVFWKKPKMLEQLMKLMFTQITRDAGEKAKDPGYRRLAEAMFEKNEMASPRRQKSEDLELDATLTASANDILRSKDFEQMTVVEQAHARRAIADLRMQRRFKKTHRLIKSRNGHAIDMRSSMRQSMRTGGDLITLARRKPKQRMRRLVVLCDISGSCSSYSRMFLHFLHSLANDRTGIDVFLFGTRLTNITRELRNRDVDEAVSKVSATVKDWSGGTRIGATLKEFNFKWSRRVLTQGSDLLLMTDGLERDEIGQLDHEMQRLRLSTKHIVWLNPLLRFDKFEARAQGIRAMMPYVDEFRPVHNLDSLRDLVDVLNKTIRPEHTPRNWLQ